MKSSWKKQRLTAKKNHIKKIQQKNAEIKYLLNQLECNDMDEFVEKISNMLKGIVSAVDNVIKRIIETPDLQKAVQPLLRMIKHEHIWESTDSYLIDVCKICGLKQQKGILHAPLLEDISLPMAAPISREMVYTPKGIMYKDDLEKEISKALRLPSLFNSATN
ncbi:MAG: hypothetical protein E6502_09635 [Lactococcus lactis]|nr:hypothetical protein [Lactococcus lactis]